MGRRTFGSGALAVVVAAGFGALACSSSDSSPAASPPPAVKLGAPFAVAGAPLGSAVPIAAPAPVPRAYGHPEDLPPPDQRPAVAASGLTKVDGWLNTTRAFTGDELAGRILVIDYWTAGCINCIHVASTLETFAHEHENDPVLVLGVHSQKFTADAEAQAVRSQMIELGVSHPVAVDTEHAEFADWGVTAWPTIFVIDAHGRVAKRIVGEPSVAELDTVVESALSEQAAEGGLATEPLGFLGRETDATTPLASPEKIVALADGYAVADTGHNRIVFVDPSGHATAVVGDGTAGLVDGPFATARFSAPKGMAAIGDVLYVADTANHALRAIRRSSGDVVTVAGTGARGGNLPAKGDALATALASPWDLVASGATVYVANAGTHQLATFDPAGATIAWLAGSGAEGLADGAAGDARFAQPSGLATDGTSLYVADAESSSIRKVDLASGAVTTLVGHGLFDWGDVDGAPDVARLEHDQGLALDGGTLYVADTYNSKIKSLDLATLVTTTVAGSATPPPFFFPGGLAIASASGGATRLLVADTDHDAISLVDPSGATPPAAFTIDGLSPP